MKRFFVLIVVALTIGSAASAQTRDALLLKFENPGYDAAPWAIWYWMYGAVSEAGVRADLEAMKEVGIGGAYLMPIKSSTFAAAPAFEPVADQLTPQFWKVVRAAAGKADTLGLKLGVHICDGFALAGGPWITPELSMQKVVWSDTTVTVDKNSSGLALARPKAVRDFYKDIAIYAFPVRDASWTGRSDNRVKVSVSTPEEQEAPGRLLDPANRQTFRSEDPCWVLYDFGKPFTARSIELVIPGYTFQANRMVIEVSDNGADFRPVRQLVPPRHGWQDAGINYTFSVPATTARYFRFRWTPEGTEPGAEDLDAAKWKPAFSVNAILLSGAPTIDQYEGKSAAVWRISPDMTSAEMPEALCVKLSEVVDLTDKAKAGLVPYYELPIGRWRILRMGHTSTGYINATGGAGRGLECDKFNPVAVRTQLNGWFEEFFRQVGQPVAGRVFKTMHVDSWECGSQNWSETFREEFMKRRGYDILPYMLLYAGIPVESAERSEAVLRDIRATVAELVRDVFYEELSACAKRYDCRLSAECVAPTMVSDGMLHYEKVDLPMGEFWFRSPTHDKLNDMLDAISGGRIYGKQIIQAEGFTQLRTMWDENPGMLKRLLDYNYALGMNKLSFHVWVQNPWLDRQPGMTLDGIGLYMQRDQSWFPLAGAWVDYIKRCQALLQSGDPVVDVAVYTGGDFPRRSVLPDRLVSSLPGIFGPERVESERLRLENAGQPERTMPVGVDYSAGTFKPEDWVDPLNGYAYDSFNEDVFLKATAVDGRMVLPGMSYKVVVFPLPDRMTPNVIYSDAVIRKIEELRCAGVMILTPDRLPYTNADFDPAVEPDLLATDDEGRPARNVAWTHRREGANDIYFVSNQEETAREVTLSFRINKEIPEFWNPVTGDVSDAPRWQVTNARTEVPLRLAPGESMFVVFRTSTDRTRSVALPPSRRTVTPLEMPCSVIFQHNGEDSWWKQEIWHRFQDWSQSADEQIKYYAGKAVYTADMAVKPKLGLARYYIEFEDVCVMARVKVNGKLCGTAWTPPYRVEVTDALRSGDNTIMIEVASTWLNRLQGVRQHGVDDLSVWTNAPFRSQQMPMQKSGIFGVTLVEETIPLIL